MIDAKCSSCGKHYSLPDQAAGKKAKCKGCGAVMQIPTAKPKARTKPAAAPDDPLGLGGVPDKAKGDLSLLYGNTGGDPIAAPSTQPVAFNPAVSFSNTPSKSSKALPIGLLLGVGGGALALVLVVIVVVVVLGSGDGDDTTSANAGLSINSGSVPKPASSDTDTDYSNSSKNSKTTDSDKPKVPLKNLPYPGLTLIEPDKKTELVDWTLDTTGFSDPKLRTVAMRGVEFLVPRSWETFGPFFTPSAPGSRIADAANLSVQSPNGEVSIDINFYQQAKSPATLWPKVYRAQRMYPKMFGFEEEDTTAEGTDADENLFGSISHPLGSAESVFVYDKDIREVTYGTLFKGFPFLRLFVQQPDDPDLPGQAPQWVSRHLLYVGYLGDQLVVVKATYPGSADEYANGIDAIVRSARLLDKEQALDSAAEDDTLRQWAKGSAVKLAFSETPPPMPDKPAAQGASTDDLIALVGALNNSDRLVGPRGKGYGILLPETMQIVSTTRAAIRTEPLTDGTWLSMEVHKLAGLERRQASPVSQDRKAILMRGRPVTIPDDVELTELESDQLTIHRLLYPPTPGTPTRRVAYIAKDGAYLITVFGNVPADQPDRLAQFDDAALTIQQIAQPEDDGEGYRIEVEAEEPETASE